MDDLERLAGKLNQLPVDPQATMGYDLFAGALVWSDERRELELITGEDGVPRFQGLGEIRALVNFRSSLTLGKPRMQFALLWRGP